MRVDLGEERGRARGALHHSLFAGAFRGGIAFRSLSSSISETPTTSC